MKVIIIIKGKYIERFYKKSFLVTSDKKRAGIYSKSYALDMLFHFGIDSYLFEIV